MSGKLPPDAYNLPSNEDIINAKNAISELTVLLQSATRVTEQANPLIRRLNDDLAILKTRIAPIKRLPFDILTLIFMEATKQDQSAPLAIELVCTTWRRRILKTPRAWSHIDLEEYFNAGVIHKYLARSKPLPISVHILKSSPHITDHIFASYLRTYTTN